LGFAWKITLLNPTYASLSAQLPKRFENNSPDGFYKKKQDISISPYILSDG